MESFESDKSKEGADNYVAFDTWATATITALLMTAGSIYVNEKKKEEIPKIDQSQVSDFFEQPADRKITRSIIMLRNAIDYGALQTNLIGYDRMIKNQPENVSVSLTNGEYMAIQARAIEIANKKGIEVGDGLSVTVDTWQGPKEIGYYGSIDIGEHITKKVVPSTFNKVYVKMSEDGKTLDFLDGKVEVITVSDDDELLTPEEKAIRKSTD